MNRRIVACITVATSIVLLATVALYIWINREKTYDELMEDVVGLQLDLAEGKGELRDVVEAYSKAAEQSPAKDAKNAEGTYSFKYVLSKVDQKPIFSSDYGDDRYIKIAKGQRIKFTLSLQAEKKFTGFSASFRHGLPSNNRAFSLSEFNTQTLKSVTGRENFNGYMLDIADGLYKPSDTAYSFEEEKVRMYNSNTESTFSFDYDVNENILAFECMSMSEELNYDKNKKLFDAQLIANENITCSVNDLVKNIFYWEYKSINYSDGDSDLGLVKGTIDIEFNISD